MTPLTKTQIERAAKELADKHFDELWSEMTFWEKVKMVLTQKSVIGFGLAVVAAILVIGLITFGVILVVVLSKYIDKL